MVWFEHGHIRMHASLIELFIHSLQSSDKYECRILIFLPAVADPDQAFWEVVK